MPRKGNVPKRKVFTDPVYGSTVVTKLINNIMLDGKKGTAQQIVYGAFEIVAQETGKDALEVFETALNNIMPMLEVKARRVGGSNYQVPVEVRPVRRQTLGLRWLTDYTRKRGERTMKERLAKEILDAANNTGASVKKKKKIHTKWQTQTVHSHTTDGNSQTASTTVCLLKHIPIVDFRMREEDTQWLELFRLKELVTLVSWLTSMQVRLRRLNVSFTTLV